MRRFVIFFRGTTYKVTAEDRASAIRKIWANAKANPIAPVTISITVTENGKSRVFTVSGKTEAEAKKKLRHAIRKTSV